jgi:hypothetical protein
LVKFFDSPVRRKCFNALSSSSLRSLFAEGMPTFVANALSSVAYQYPFSNSDWVIASVSSVFLAIAPILPVPPRLAVLAVPPTPPVLPILPVLT